MMWNSLTWSDLHLIWMKRNPSCKKKYIGQRACKSPIFVIPIHPLTNYIDSSRYRSLGRSFLLRYCILLGQKQGLSTTVVFGEQLNIDTISTFKIFDLMNHQAPEMCNFINQTSLLCSSICSVYHTLTFCLRHTKQSKV